MTLKYVNYGIILFMGNAGFISSTVLWLPWFSRDIEWDMRDNKLLTPHV